MRNGVFRIFAASRLSVYRKMIIKNETAPEEPRSFTELLRSSSMAYGLFYKHNAPYGAPFCLVWWFPGLTDFIKKNFFK